MLEPWQLLPISQICRGWRQVAISTPRLWTKIGVRVQSWNFDNKMSLIKMFCERISGFHLSVIIVHRLDDDRFDGQKLVQVLTPYLKQICSLDLNLPVDSFLAFADVSTDSFSHLTSFIFISASEELPTITIIPHTISFSYAHHLARFSFDGDLPLPTALQLPGQLTELSLDRVTPRQLIQILQHTPNIMTLTCAIYTTDSDQSYNDQVIVILMPHLFKLELIADTATNICYILNYITAPSLLDLSIDCWSMHFFSSFVERSSCSLTKLSFRGADIPPQEFIECLSMFSSLVELDLENIRSTNNFMLEQLIYHPARRFNLLPALSVLKVQVANEHYLPIVYYDQMFIEIVKSRWQPDFNRPSRLNCCRLYFQHFPASKKEDLIHQVDVLRNEGLDIKIAFSESDFEDWVRDYESPWRIFFLYSPFVFYREIHFSRNERVSSLAIKMDVFANISLPKRCFELAHNCLQVCCALVAQVDEQT